MENGKQQHVTHALPAQAGIQFFRYMSYADDFNAKGRKKLEIEN